MLAALVEAALGALYLEHGFETVRPAILAAFADRIDYALTTYVDYKTELQEELARREPERLVLRCSRSRARRTTAASPARP